jgi:hypothetical protein
MMVSLEIVGIIVIAAVSVFMVLNMIKQDRKIESLETRVNTLAKVLAEYEQHLGILQQATKFRVSTRQAR